MCAKYEDAEKLPMLSSQEMRKVLDDVLEGDPICPEDAEEHQDLSGVLEGLPDLEGECSILSLGWDDNLGLETGDSAAGSAEESTAEGVAKDEHSKKSQKKDISCWSKVKVKDKHFHEPVPIQKGDMIEFLLEDKTWFLVEVTGRGKAGGRNRNYLNVRYSDGSEGGVFIDKHEWRIVEKKEVPVEEVTTECSVRLHRVTVGYPDVDAKYIEESSEKEDKDEETMPSESDHKSEGNIGATPSLPKNRKKRKRKRPPERQPKQTHSIEIPSDNLSHKSKGDPAGSLRKGDIIEFLVEEDDDDEDDTWFLVEILGRGKARGKNRNYLNVRYKDKSEGGVFIDKHQWRLVRRAGKH